MAVAIATTVSCVKIRGEGGPGLRRGQVGGRGRGHGVLELADGRLTASAGSISGGSHGAGRELGDRF